MFTRFLIRCALVLSVCIGGVVAPSRAADSLEVKVVRDLSYKAEAATEYERTRCKLDVYAPPESHGLPCIVWFHGGGLTGGDKNMPSVLRALAGEGFVVASANYRLSP